MSKFINDPVALGFCLGLAWFGGSVGMAFAFGIVFLYVMEN